MLKHKLALTHYTASYLDQGVGIPLIFLHGFLGEARAWQPLIDCLQDQYRCVALDLLGFGESSKPQLKYNIWHQVQFLQEFLAAAQIDNFYLIGHSYGGWVTAAYAIENTGQLLPQTLQGIGLIAPAGIRDDSFAGRYNYLKPLLWETKFVDIALAAIAPLANLAGQQKQFATIRQARQALLAQPVAKSFIVDRLRPEDAIDTVEKHIANITVPALIIAGTQDDTIPLWHCHTYAEQIPQASLEIFPDADHALIQTHSLEISQLLTAKLIKNPTKER